MNVAYCTHAVQEAGLSGRWCPILLLLIWKKQTQTTTGLHGGCRLCNGEITRMTIKTCSLRPKYNYMHYNEHVASSKMLGWYPSPTKTIPRRRYYFVKCTAGRDSDGDLRNKSNLRNHSGQIIGNTKTNHETRHHRSDSQKMPRHQNHSINRLGSRPRPEPQGLLKCDLGALGLTTFTYL